MHFNIINEPLLEIFKDFGNEFAVKILDNFMLQTKILTKELEFAYDNQDLKKVYRIAKKLRKSSNELGFTKFALCCTNIERSALKKTTKELPFLIVSISQETKLLEMSLCEVKSVVLHRKTVTN